MTRTALSEYLSQPGNSQLKLAALVDLRQSAISKMLRVKRQIFVIVNEDGLIELREAEKTIATQKT